MLLANVSTTVKAAGVSDDCQYQVDQKELEVAEQCGEILSQAQRIILDQEKSLALRDLLIQEQTKELNAIDKQLKLELSKKSAWYNNPYIMFGLGVIVTGAGAAALSR